MVASLIGEHGFEHVGSVAVARGTLELRLSSCGSRA